MLETNGCSGFAVKNRQVVVKIHIRLTLQRLLNLPRRREHGQSMVEMALALPILLLILAGTVEVGWYYNTNMTVVDASREAARRSANNSIDPTRPDVDCASTEEFFKQAGCLAVQALDRNTPGLFNPARDDILVSVVTVKGNTVLTRFVDSNFAVGDSWSYCQKVLNGVGCTRAYSRYPNSVLQARLSQFISSTPAVDPTRIPNEAYVLVEIYHVHHQFLGLIPPDLAFLPQEVVMHGYTIMPVPAVAQEVQ
jgi:hypothetical protein